MAPQPSHILLKGGVLLVHSDDGKVVPQRSDLLIEGNRVSQIGDNIDTSGQDVQLIDCQGKIVSPGFISTHRHVWQTALKGPFYTAEDAFWGELGGALEAIDGGTTTVVDHSSLNMGPDFPPTMIQALVASGLGAVYCYCVPRSVPSWKPLATQDDYSSPRALEGWKALAAKAPFGDGRIQLGFVVDSIYQSPEQMKSLYGELRAAGAKVITTHGAGGLAFNNPPSALQILNSHGLLGPDVLISHANFPHENDAEILAKHNAWISATPNTELQMGWPPLGLRPECVSDCNTPGSNARRSSVDRAGGVGIPAHPPSRCSTSPPSEVLAPSAWPGEVGQIKVGALADLVVFDASSPAMLPAGEEDPLAAVVFHSSERDVETVIVGGIVRKENFRLLPVTVEGGVEGAKDIGLDGKQIGWSEVARNLLESRKRLNAKAEGIDFKAAEDSIIDAFRMNRKDMLGQQ
ncbi:5'-deoxyadenosine deaminase [Colletotrichum trifolii]|uniref:5'-deoxyadenosine deaminase n=1 Tax=Colletotrichum trifolii TaxID=5466 RepID=A0A4R8R1N5_COLTR|nr:5'-deoxyadenosine deaminase [Colletotrichum trifolii]